MLTQKEIDDIIEYLDNRRPQIVNIKGINNKRTYVQLDAVYKVLHLYKAD